MTFKFAENLYKNRKYEEAIENYLEVLNKLPEYPVFSAQALSNVAKSYLKIEDELMARVTAHYLAERFREEPVAADTVLSIAGHFQREDNEPAVRQLFDVFSANFTNNMKAALVTYQLAEYDRRDGIDKKRPKILERAMGRYSRVIEMYPDSKYYLRSLERRGIHYINNGDYDKAIPDFQKMVKDAPPGQDRARAYLNLANCYYNKREMDAARQVYEKLEQEFKTERTYLKPENKDLVKSMREQILFSLGMCYSQQARLGVDLKRQIMDALKAKGLDEEKARPVVDEGGAKLDQLATKVTEIQPLVTQLKAAPTNTDELQSKAENYWEEQLRKYPTGQYAASAMDGRARILLVQEDTKGAIQQFRQLSNKFPDAKETQQAYYFLVKELIGLGRASEARNFATDMLKSPKEYTPLQMFLVGRLMNQNGFYAEGGRFFDAVLKHPDTLPKPGEDDASLKKKMAIQQRTLYEYALAMNEQKKFIDAQAKAKLYLDEYPNGAYFFKMSFELAQAHLGLKQYTEALNALTPVVNYAKDEVTNIRANLEMARIQKQAGMDRPALGSYHRLTIRPRPETGDGEALLEEALLEGLRFCIQQEEWKAASQVGEGFLELLPESTRTRDVENLLQQVAPNLPREKPETPDPGTPVENPTTPDAETSTPGTPEVKPDATPAAPPTPDPAQPDTPEKVTEPAR